MPARRPRVCESCRIAKARCSLSVPCVRCEKRKIACRYAPRLSRGYERREDYGCRVIRPAESSHSVGIPTCTTIRPATGNISSDGHHVPVGHTVTITPAAMAVTADFQPLLLTVESQNIYQNDEWSSSFDMSSSSCFQNFDNLPSFNTPSLSWLSDVNFSGEKSGFIAPPSIELSRTGSNLEIPRSPTAYIPSSLSLRKRSLQQGSLTAKMVFSRLTGYTQMLADGKLPPFIHVPCALGCNEECPPTSRHRCLPETLAICTNLTQMFHARMPGSHGFVWQQICTHVRQMRAEYGNYNEQKLLQAMQAAAVYGMICSQCTDSVPSDDAAWIVDTIEIIGERLYDMCVWALNAGHLCATRNEWVLMESMRRILCLIYLIDVLLQIDAQSPSSGKCPDFVNMPLPCVRDLWQPVSDREWRKRYEEEKDAAKQKGKLGLTYKDLLMLKRSSTIYASAAGSPEPTKELTDWCERADDFSMILWMALSLEGEGQLQYMQ